jgi:hypothetical protein
MTPRVERVPAPDEHRTPHERDERSDDRRGRGRGHDADGDPLAGRPRRPPVGAGPPPARDRVTGLRPAPPPQQQADGDELQHGERGRAAQVTELRGAEVDLDLHRRP